MRSKTAFSYISLQQRVRGSMQILKRSMPDTYEKLSSKCAFAECATQEQQQKARAAGFSHMQCPCSVLCDAKCDAICRALSCIVCPGLGFGI